MKKDNFKLSNEERFSGNMMLITPSWNFEFRKRGKRSKTSSLAKLFAASLFHDRHVFKRNDVEEILIQTTLSINLVESLLARINSVTCNKYARSSKSPAALHLAKLQRHNK